MTGSQGRGTERLSSPFGTALCCHLCGQDVDILRRGVVDGAALVGEHVYNLIVVLFIAAR